MSPAREGTSVDAVGIPSRKGRTEHECLPAGGVFSERSQEGGSEENPKPQRAKEGEQGVPEGRHSCEVSDPCGQPGCRRRHASRSACARLEKTPTAPDSISRKASAGSSTV